MKAKIEISLKDGILDPQAKTILKALESLGFNYIKDLKTRKVIELTLNIDNKEEALEQAKEMSEMLLANPVIENYTIELIS